MLVADSLAYWVAPDGRAISVHGSHTDTVLETPEAFGLTRESATGLFNDGEERSVLMHLLERGWIRIRLHADRYFVAANKLDVQCKELIKQWALGVLELHGDYARMGVVLEEESSGNIYTDTLENLIAESLFNVRKIESGGGAAIIPVRDEYELWSLLPAKDLRRKLDDIEESIGAGMGKKARRGHINKVMASWGAWISPEGLIIGLPGTHIRYVVENPAEFGLSTEQVRDIFAKHNEGVGSEGHARDEIVAMLVTNGWIRIRYHSSDKAYHVELQRLGSESKGHLYTWASQVAEKFPDCAETSVIVSEVMGEDLYFKSRFQLSSLLDGRKLASGEKPPDMPPIAK